MACSSVSTAKGARVYTVGDIHGCPSEPEVLLKHLTTKEGLGADDTVIFLGDYIDRGPNSRAVVDLLLDFKSKFPGTRFLRGNHEDMLLDFLGFGGNLGEAFLYNGGVETIQSYGISVFASVEEMVDALPVEHRKFFRELESIVIVDDFICVHAGLNPLRDLDAQNDGDVFWIRDEFLHNIHPFKKTVVFGHTPHREVVHHLPYKVGIDTGLVFGNKLSCLELRSGRILQVAREARHVAEGKVDLASRVFP